MGADSLRSPALGLHHLARPELRALPGLLQAMALLPLAQHDLEAVVSAAAAQNPMLERAARPPCAGCGFPGAGPRCRHCRTTGGRMVPAPEPVDDPFSTWEVLAACVASATAAPALPIVIGHLTARGLLDAAPEQIAVQHGLAIASVREAIAAVQVAGPAGIASASVTELLTRQAQALADRAEAPPWLPVLIRDHLPLVAEQDAGAVSMLLGISRPEADAAFALIRRRLRPSIDLSSAGSIGAGSAGDAPAGIPDVFVYRTGGHLFVLVAGSADLGLDVEPVTGALRAHAEAGPWLRRHERAARDLIAQIDARAGTLTRVAAEVVARQRGYFTDGPSAQADLTRTEVAAALSLHPSTVSRTVADKIMRHPGGRLDPLADLLGTGTAIRLQLAELIGSSRSRGGAPPSDAVLAAALRDRGVVIARRTVAKYRAQLGVPAGGPGGRRPRGDTGRP